MNQVFYKGVLESDLIPGYIPGSVTRSQDEAQLWADRIASKKTKGAARHIRHGKSVVIRMVIDTSGFANCDEFQRENVKEHERRNCWMNVVRTKAQVNTPVEFLRVTTN
jgi:hypothetical protein